MSMAFAVVIFNFACSRMPIELESEQDPQPCRCGMPGPTDRVCTKIYYLPGRSPRVEKSSFTPLTTPLRIWKPLDSLRSTRMMTVIGSRSGESPPTGSLRGAGPWRRTIATNWTGYKTTTPMTQVRTFTQLSFS